MLATEIQSLSPTALIELFVVDATVAGGGLFYFHAGTNKLGGSVVWQGNTYHPLPVEASGFDLSAKGVLPRPKLKAANENGAMSALMVEMDDLVGCKVIRKRTFAKYLDAVNFPGSVNPTADQNQHFTDDHYFIERKVSESRKMVEWELSSAFDLEGVKLPRRQIINDSCVWIYKSAECGYVGTNYFDANDDSCPQASDMCGKRLNSCRLRFDGADSLPFGGFPGALRYADN